MAGFKAIIGHEQLIAHLSSSMKNNKVSHAYIFRRKIANEEVNLWEERSKTKQDLFNKQINSEAAKFYKEELIPQLNIEMKEKLGNGEWILADTEDEMVVNFYYPDIFHKKIHRF